MKSDVWFSSICLLPYSEYLKRQSPGTHNRVFREILILYCLQARISAVNGEDCAGRERGRVACKIEHQSDHFVRLGDPAHRRAAEPLRDRGVVRRTQPSGRERRVGKAGADRVDAHAALRPLVGHALCQHDDARLG